MVQVTLKTLSQGTFTVEVPDTATIRDVKMKIQEVKGAGFEAAQQKLIAAGKVLDDALTLTEHRYTPDKNLVLMVTKLRTAAAAGAAAAAPAAPAGAAAAAAAPAAAAAASQGTGGGAAADTPKTGDDVTSAIAANATAPTAESVRRLCDMGFPEDQVKAALTAAFNNVEVAANYLMTGLPDFAGPDFHAHPANMETAGVGGTVGIMPADVLGGAMADDNEMEGDDDLMGGDDSDALAANPLAHLRTHPQFMQLRAMVQANPDALHDIMETIGAQAPELFNLIHEHPQAFVQLLNDTGDDDDDEGDEGAAGEHVVVLNEEDVAAIAQLQAIVPQMSREQVAEAYLACDKNLEMAMNMLFNDANK